MKYLLFLSLLLSFACVDNGNTPESALKDFVERRLENVATRDDVVGQTTGKLRLSLESMDDQDFAKFADLRDYKKSSFRIISKSCQEKRCYVTYAIGYKQSPAGKTQWTSEVKKIAELQWEDGRWLIADVSNIKTYHESAQQIEVSP
jgi:hypothetical protein